MALLVSRPKKWLWWNLPKKRHGCQFERCWETASVKFGQFESWTMIYLYNVFMAVLVKHFIDNLKKIITTINIWHILHLTWISPKIYLSPHLSKFDPHNFKVLLPVSSQVPNQGTFLPGGTSTYLSARRMKSALESWSPGGNFPPAEPRFDDTPQKSNKGVSENGGTPKWMVYNGKPY